MKLHSSPFAKSLTEDANVLATESNDDAQNVKMAKRAIFDVAKTIQNLRSNDPDVEAVFRSVEDLLDTARGELHKIDR